VDDPSPYGPGAPPPADPITATRPRTRFRFWLLVSLGLLVIPSVLALVAFVNGFALWDSEPANAGLATAALVAIPVAYGATCLFVLGTALRRGAHAEKVLAEYVTLGLAVAVPVTGYVMIFPPPPEDGPVVASGTDQALHYSSDIAYSMSWAPELIEAVEIAADRGATVAAIESFEYPNAAGDSLRDSYNYDVDVTAFEGVDRPGEPGRGVLKVSVEFEAGQWDEDGTISRWSAGTAATCLSFRVSAADGVHDQQPVDCADAGTLPSAKGSEMPAAEPEPSPTTSARAPTDPVEIRLLDLLGSLGPQASEEAVARVVGAEFPGTSVETDRSDNVIVVVVGEWEDCLVGVLPADGAPFRFTGFDRVLLTRGEMGCSPQLYLNPVTTH